MTPDVYRLFSRSTRKLFWRPMYIIYNQAHEVVKSEAVQQRNNQSRHIAVSSTTTSTSQLIHHRLVQPQEPPYFTDVRSQVRSNCSLGPYYGLQRIHPIMLLRCSICYYSRPGTTSIHTQWISRSSNEVFQRYPAIHWTRNTASSGECDSTCQHAVWLGLLQHRTHAMMQTSDFLEMQCFIL